jgi:fluoroquinolone resistance protein
LVIKNTVFTNCNLQEVDFTETNLLSSTFDTCDLSKAIFENSNLEKVDFSTATNFTINPEINNVKKASFSKENIEGLLNHLQIVIK